MKSIIIHTIFFTFFALNFALSAEIIKIKPDNAVIVLSDNKNHAVVTAAAELRKHLKLITGSDIPVVSPDKVTAGKYAFRVGAKIPGDSKPLAPEEARWKVTPEGTYFYGDDSSYRSGTLFAVCDFLEKMFKVRWIEPGDIAFTRQNPLQLTLSSSDWKSELRLRNIRGTFRKTPGKTTDAALNEFQMSPEEHARFKKDVISWRKRLRMGGHDSPAYGHAFTNWWRLYGKTHPEYFALTGSGKRAPVPKSGNASDNPVAPTAQSIHHIKLCISNPAVVAQIVKNWLAQKNRTDYINACVNDSPPRGFCRCPKCRALDVTLRGEKFGDHLTDRYVDFGNRIIKEAAKHDPSAKAVIYAYNETEYPPRRTRLDKNLVIGLVTTHFELDSINKLFHGWTKMGAKEIFFRPNQHHYYFTGTIPTGFEKHFYEVFQTAYKNNVIGFDYDCLINNWLVTGMADYILAKAMSEPTKSFDYWENHYLDAFGAAKPEVKKYFDYWRENVWEKRINPHLTEIVKKGKWYNFVRGLMWNLGKYYKESDFDNTDIYLKNALRCKLSPEETARVKKLQVANRHARLVFKAVTTPEPAKFRYSLELLNFRRQHKDFGNVIWAKIFNYESYWGDITGIRAAVKFQDYALPFIKTPLFWSFRLDPDGIGDRDGWYKQSNMDSWDIMPTNNFWEKPYPHYKHPSAETRKKLTNYNGVGWYSCQLKVPANWKNRKVFLYFGAVDESCWVYVNGKLVGKHLFEKPDDWNSPFSISIDAGINWGRPTQLVTVKVEDKSGSGGIWKPVWLVSKKNKQK